LQLNRFFYAFLFFENGIALEMIAQILGHKNTDTTKQYLSIAEQALAKCTLPMPHYSGLMEVKHG
jgi:site-specific recombinase XerD